MTLPRRLHRQSIRGNDAGSLRMPSRGPVGAGQDGVARRKSEERVLAFVAEGLTNKKIATTMKLRDKTVKSSLANMFQKLHITRRSQAAAFFVRRET